MAEFSYEPGEQVMESVRKHPLIVIGQLIPFALLAWLPTLLPNAVELMQAGGHGTGAWIGVLSDGNPWVRFVIGIYWLFVWMGAFTVFTDYYLDQWIITNHRIVQIEQIGFWNREVSSLHLNRIQDVMTDVNGVFPTLFGYGTLSVETAAADERRFRIRGIRGARRLRDLIMKEVTERQEKLAKQSLADV